MSPIASVVLCVRNGERTLARAIDSILCQTVADIELIVVDDGSSDATGQIVGSYHDPRILSVRTDAIGLTAALRTGMARASAEIIARQDADDISFPTRIERQLEVFQSRPDVVVVGVNWEERDGLGRPLAPRIAFRPGDVGTSLLVANPIFHGAVAFRRSAYERVGGYDTTFRTAQDYDLWLRLAEIGVVWNHDEVLAVRTMDGTNIAATREQQQHRAALRARWSACRRRGTVRSWPQLTRGVVSVLVPPQLKRPVRRLRGQAA